MAASGKRQRWMAVMIVVVGLACASLACSVRRLEAAAPRATDAPVAPSTQPLSAAQTPVEVAPADTVPAQAAATQPSTEPPTEVVPTQPAPVSPTAEPVTPTDTPGPAPEPTEDSFDQEVDEILRELDQLLKMIDEADPLDDLPE